MNNEQLIPVQQICIYHEVEYGFIHTLHEHGLIVMTTQGNEQYIAREQMPHLERMIRLHYDLDINVEGLDAIMHLLEQMDAMKHEMNTLKNRLLLYEYNRTDFK